MRLLILPIHEPLPGSVLPEMATICGEIEAARRYRALAVTTLRQLRDLADTRIRLEASPDDAAEAIRFWILPRLADRWQMDGGVYRTDGWEIDFGETSREFSVVATAAILCPFLSARWIHAGLLGLGRSVSEVIGPATAGGEYLYASAPGHHETEARFLPELPVITTHADWQEAMQSPLQGALKRAWEEET